MFIIFGDEQVQELRSKYTVLALDTFRFLPEGLEKIAYAVVENISIVDMPRIESLSNMHNCLLENYRKRDWNYCEQAIEQLIGAWGGELDSFYDELRKRIAKYQEADPGENWDPVIEKIVSDSPA